MTTATQMLQAREITNQLGHPFDQTFRFQFFLSKKDFDVPEFTLVKCGQWNLYHCPELPRTSLTDSSGKVIGFVLGYAVDDQGVLLSGKHSIPGKGGHRETDLEEFIKWLGGRFVVITNYRNSDRIYVDPAASFGIVYNKSEKIVASSLLLALTRKIDPNPYFDLDDLVAGHPKFRVKQQHTPSPFKVIGHTGFGHTADRTVKRARPNHFLDLSNFSEVRYWPNNGDLKQRSLADASETIAKRLRAIQRAIYRENKVYISLSGGKDSRLLLSTVSDKADHEVQLFTYAANWIGVFDTMVAGHIADMLGQELKVLIPPSGHKGSFFLRPKRSARLSEQFIISTGFDGTADLWWKKGYSHQLQSDHLLVRGNFLELVTARFWPRHKQERMDDIAHILKRIGIAILDEADLERKTRWTADWIESFSLNISPYLHDLSYVELALPYSQPWFHGINRQFYVAPACDRAIFKAAMEVPANIRKNNSLFDAIIGMTTPPLLGLPTVREARWTAKKTGTDISEILKTAFAVSEKRFADYNIAGTT